jgi:CheY-like chemotaxis protein
VISSRIRVPGENGALRVATQHPLSLKFVVRPSSCIPETASVALILATNGYLGAFFSVEADSTVTSIIKNDIRKHKYFPAVFIQDCELINAIDAVVESIAAQDVSSRAPIASDKQPKRILIVDDSDVIRHGIRWFLEMTGYLCIEAADGAEAITKARQSKPDLIVMDLVMPGINGIEATSMIRSTMPSVPIIAFTMYESMAKAMTSRLAISTVVSKPDGLTVA